MLLLGFILVIFMVYRIESKPPYCLPSNTNCWPTSGEISDFSSKLIGELVTNTSRDYNQYVDMTQDLLYRNQYPSFIVICWNVGDIQQSVLFASSHNIQISIISTGHSYSGRNTANYSLQINLSKMRNYKINKNSRNGEMESITVETGLQWGSIFGLTAPNIVIGPDDPSVGPGGSSLRGGHSPIGPHYGLVSDFTLEYFMVDAHSHIIHIYNTSGINQTIDDLLWSLKGGGGSTFGVIVNITFKVHKPEPAPNVFTNLQCVYQYEIQKQFIGDEIFNNLWNAMQNGLDPQWGGYFVTTVEQNALLIDFNFYGNQSYAQSNGQPLLHLADPHKTDGICKWNTYQTFIEFESTFTPYTGGTYQQYWADLVPLSNLTEEYTNTLTAFFNASSKNKNGYQHQMVAVMQGGKINSFPDDYTSVTPGFRHNQIEMMLGLLWSDPKYTNDAIKHANEWEANFTKFGYGKYSNEENRACGDGCDWKELFYGQAHYDRLLKVKQKWDPNQVFWCYHCVGSDYYL